MADASNNVLRILALRGSDDTPTSDGTVILEALAVEVVVASAKRRASTPTPRPSLAAVIKAWNAFGWKACSWGKLDDDDDDDDDDEAGSLSNFPLTAALAAANKVLASSARAVA